MKIQLLLVLLLLTALGIGAAAAALESPGDRPSPASGQDRAEQEKAGLSSRQNYPDLTLGLSPSEDDEVRPPAVDSRNAGGQSSATSAPASPSASGVPNVESTPPATATVSEPRPARSPMMTASLQAIDPAPDGNGSGGESAESPYRQAEVEDLPTKEPGEKWTIPQPPVLKTLGITMYGWLDQGATLNSLSPRDRWNGPVDLNDRSNEYELNQFWLGFERPVKTDGCGFDVGGRVDIMYGTDWRYGDCLGLEQNFNAQNQLYGLVLPQFYMEVGWNNLTVKMGHYAALMGYEVVGAPATSSTPIPTP